MFSVASVPSVYSRIEPNPSTGHEGLEGSPWPWLFQACCLPHPDSSEPVPQVPFRHGIGNRARILPIRRFSCIEENISRSVEVRDSSPDVWWMTVRETWPCNALFSSSELITPLTRPTSYPLLTCSITLLHLSGRFLRPWYFVSTWCYHARLTRLCNLCYTFIVMRALPSHVIF